MAKTKSMTTNQNHDDDTSSYSSCSRERSKTFDNGDVASWSNLNYDVLYLVMSQLGVVDFLSFSGVCKSWRSYALFNKNTFMASRPPMSLSIEPHSNNKDSNCYLKDSEGRRFKTILPHSYDVTCFGSTCGYVILFGRLTRDFWLVNPITRHKLRFRGYPLAVGAYEEGISALLVFSPSISGLVFVVLNKKISHYIQGKPQISYYIAGKGRWNHVSSSLHIVDLHVFKGKIYPLHTDCSLGELKLNQNQKCKLTLLETKSFPNPRFFHFFHRQLVSAGETIYVINRYSNLKKVMELDFGEMKWVSPDKTIGEYALFISGFSSCAAIKPESWADPQTRYKLCGYFCNDDGSQQSIYYYEQMCYFPHECLNVSALAD